MSIRAYLRRTFSTPAVRRFFFNKSGYNQLGLLRDDLYDEEYPGVKEAIRRLPPKVRDERVYRIIRAHQLTINHAILPKDEWTTFEADENNRYLLPYLEEVEKEMKERNQWSKAH